LESNPERTAKSLLFELMDRYPGQYHKNQLRTLQRRVKEWRAKAILTFHDEWIHEEDILEESIPGNLGIMKDTEVSRGMQPTLPT
jgi:hypothetical protein